MSCVHGIGDGCILCRQGVTADTLDAADRRAVVVRKKPLRFFPPDHLPDAGKLIRPPCVHLGPVQSPCPLGDPLRDVRHCLCEKTDAGRCWRSAIPSTDMDVASCERCPHYDPGPAPKSAVVIGSYNLPKLIGLQVRMIRHHCGDVPILVVDDCSDGYGHTPGPTTVVGQLRKIAATTPNVFLFTHPTRFGHASGDLSKLWTGIQWAKAHGVEVLAALSQRLLIDRPQWLQHGAIELKASGLATASQPCKEGAATFPIRSEAILLDVNRWHTPAILDHLMPRALSGVEGKWGIAAEHVIMDDIRHRLDGRFHPWSLFGHDRGVRYPGIVWHCSHGRRDYEQLASKFGTELDAHFSTDGWRNIQGMGYKG